MLLRESIPTFPFPPLPVGGQSPHPGYPVCTSAVQEAHVTVTVTVLVLPSRSNIGNAQAQDPFLHFPFPPLPVGAYSPPHPGYPVCTSAVQEAHVTVTVTVTILV